jgi:transglycosylase-like protein with SLT domain
MVTRVIGTLMLLMINGKAFAIEPLYQDVAQYVGVPADILYAMSKAESGLLKDKKFQPWPWTLNIAGTAKRYNDRESMFAGLMTALGTGEQRIDVGPMQVNWYWQFEVMGSPWRITDPTVNIKIAAQILKTHYDRSGDWWDAVGRYHRPADGPRDRLIAEQYRQRVLHFYDSVSPAEDASDAA